MSELPLVTIVTPSLNQAQFLEDTMLSVMGQDYPAVEFIVVDGGSTDGSIEIIRRHQARLAYWTSEPDSGQSTAINKGFARAKGRIFAWLNSDDLLSPSALSIAAHFLNSEPDVGLVYGDRVEIDAKGNVIGVLRCPPHDPGIFRKDVTLPQETAFFRREVYEAVGGLDEDLHFAMDLDLWCKMAKVTRMRHIPAFLACFRRHRWSKSVTYDATVDEKHQRYHRERELVMGRHFGRELPGRLEQRLYHWRRKAALVVASRSAQYRADLATVARLRAGGSEPDL